MYLDPEHVSQVRAILAAQLPSGVCVFVFGSRAHGRGLKKFSDLDLCLKGDAPVGLAVTEGIAAAFAESDLPIRVDVVDWFAISEEFQSLIANDLQPFR